VRKREVRRSFRWGLYNCKVGRPPHRVRDFVEYHLIERRGWAVVLLFEAAGYQRVLAQIEGYTLFQYDTTTDSDNLAVLVRNDLVARFRFLRRMKVWWWGKRRSRRREPRSVLGVNAGGVLFVPVHRVAYQHFEQNLRANKEIDDFLISLPERFPQARLVPAGDMNDGVHSPEMQRVITEGGYNAISTGGVMFALYRGAVKIDEPVKLGRSGGSDHRPEEYVATVYSRGRR
jgi:hypothetical protein